MDIRTAGPVARAAGLGVASLVANWMRTLQFEIAYCGGEINDPGRLDFQEGIFLIWHEYLILPLYTHGFCNVKMLVSQHQDAEWLTQAGWFLGFDGVRGSTGRNAVAALRQCIREGENTSFAITPDGPRGPRRTLTEGAVFLASKAQLPLICIGGGYDRPWRINQAWDKFAIPRPYSRARMVISHKILPPKRLGRAKLEFYSRYVQDTLDSLTGVAEDWAKTGKRMEGSMVFHRRPRPRGRNWETPPPPELRYYGGPPESRAA